MTIDSRIVKILVLAFFWLCERSKANASITTNPSSLSSWSRWSPTSSRRREDRSDANIYGMTAVLIIPFGSCTDSFNSVAKWCNRPMSTSMKPSSRRASLTALLNFRIWMRYLTQFLWFWTELKEKKTFDSMGKTRSIPIIAKDRITSWSNLRHLLSGFPSHYQCEFSDLMKKLKRRSPCS